MPRARSCLCGICAKCRHADWMAHKRRGEKRLGSWMKWEYETELGEICRVIGIPISPISTLDPRLWESFCPVGGESWGLSPWGLPPRYSAPRQ